MANIDSYLEQIRSAVYGEEVRGSIQIGRASCRERV